MAFDFPANPTIGQIVHGPGGVTWTWDGTKWVSSGSSGGASITISDTAPANPAGGALWFDSVGLQLYVFYNDGNSSQWVPVNNQALAGFLALTGGTLTGPLIGTTLALSGALSGAAATFSGLLTPSGGIHGVTNGSAATAGSVGEYLNASQALLGIGTASWTSGSQITLTPGQWLVWGEATFQPTAVAITQALCGIGTTLNAVPTTPAMGVSAGALGAMSYATPPIMYNVTANTTLYLNCYVSFSSGTCQFSNTIAALRVR